MEGLTSDEVEQRVRDGRVNRSKTREGTTYTRIFIKNAFTPLNCILILLGFLLLLCDNIVSAASATLIILVNILVSTVQEMRAKHRLDKIALLTSPKATVLRDGVERVVDGEELVSDDVVILRAGDQALVDGDILECRSLEMDESLLTGESSSIRKSAGDRVLSGSVCIAGEGYYRVTDFGEGSYASQMLKSARSMTSKKTPLQMETTTITSILMAIAGILMAASLVLEMLVRNNSWEHTLEVFVICLDIVPIALFLLITLTYMVAAVRMADSGVLLQNSNSVESISHIDTVCMDKTGTVTTNKLKFEFCRCFIDEGEARRKTSMFATATGSRNKTVGVLLDVFGETPCRLLDEVQFTSARKYSAVRIYDGGKESSLYMGAWSVLRPHCDDAEAVSAMVEEESSKGMRTVVICEGEGPLHQDGEPRISRLRPIIFITISDEIRPDCRETIKVFVDNGLDIKVISGDDPSTVDAMFSLAGIPGERRLLSGSEMAALEGKEKEKAILESNIFGRMRPEDKEEVIDVLVKNGRYVAMIGDGVNDVRSLKAAQVGVALGSGSNAARGVSDMVLMEDSFSALPKAIMQGRRTVSGMRDILKLYLTRNFALAILFVFTYFLVGSVPVIPIQNVFYAFISVSAIAFFMTLFSKPEGSSGLILPKVLKFAVPSAVCIAGFGIMVYAVTWMLVGNGTITPDYEWMASVGGFSDVDALLMHMSWSGSGWEEICARSAMLLFVTIAGVGQIMMVSPYFRFMSVDGSVNKSLLPWFVIGLIALALAAAFVWFPFVLVYLVEMVIFPVEVYGALAVVLIVWFLLERTIHRYGLMDGLAGRFEKRFMKKLSQEYNKNRRRLPSSLNTVIWIEAHEHRTEEEPQAAGRYQHSLGHRGHGLGDIRRHAHGHPGNPRGPRGRRVHEARQGAMVHRDHSRRSEPRAVASPRDTRPVGHDPPRALVRGAVHAGEARDQGIRARACGRCRQRTGRRQGPGMLRLRIRLRRGDGGRIHALLPGIQAAWDGDHGVQAHQIQRRRDEGGSRTRSRQDRQRSEEAVLRIRDQGLGPQEERPGRPGRPQRHRGLLGQREELRHPRRRRPSQQVRGHHSQSAQGAHGHLFNEGDRFLRGGL